MSLNKDEKLTIKNAMAIIQRETADNGDSFRLQGLGTFNRKVKPARTARNPRTGDPIAVPARSVLTFKASPATRRDQ